LALILNHLHQNGPISRSELATQLGINKASISTTVRELIKRGIVIELGQKSGNQEVGHPSIDIMVNPDAGRIVGVNLESDRVRAVITDVSPNILWRKEIRFHSGAELEELFATTKMIIDEACRVARTYGFPVLGLGLGLPGLVDIEKNLLLAAFELNWRDYDLDQLMVGNEDIPFYVGNEGRMSAMGESYYGDFKKSDLTIYIHWGIETSGGIIVNEDVLPGSLGLAGEVGHLSINPEGDRCTCGNSGCWNAYINVASIWRRIITISNSDEFADRNHNYQEFSLDNLINLALADDPNVIKALEETAKWLGIGISNYINLLNPEFVIIGGPLSVLFDKVSPTIQREVEQRALPWQRSVCPIRPSIHREDACLIGTVATVIWNILNNPK
jgi:predicted NBD/HSP70 family sugar kinase/biotin operon repressor